MALLSLRANFLRSLLTLMIISVGITCLVGILTAIDAILFSMSDSFNQLGANSFRIRPAAEEIRGHGPGRRVKRADPIVFDQAMEFKEKVSGNGAVVSVNSFASSSATIKYRNEETNPTVTIIGIDDNYFDVSALDISHGRAFTNTETLSSSPKVILGYDIIKQLFNEKPDKAIDKIVTVNAQKYKVIGVLEAKGSSFGGGADRRVYIPLMLAKQLYGHAKTSYQVNASIVDATQIDRAVSQSIGAMRNIRGLKEYYACICHRKN